MIGSRPTKFERGRRIDLAAEVISQRSHTKIKDSGPVCRYCGFFVNQHPERCPALDEGRCEP